MTFAEVMLKLHRASKVAPWDHDGPSQLTQEQLGATDETMAGLKDKCLVNDLKIDGVRRFWLSAYALDSLSEDQRFNMGERFAMLAQKEGLK